MNATACISDAFSRRPRRVCRELQIGEMESEMQSTARPRVTGCVAPQEKQQSEISGVYPIVRQDDGDWIRDRGSQRLHRATNSISVPTEAIDRLVLHEWLAESMPGWSSAPSFGRFIPVLSQGREFVSVVGARIAGIGSHSSEWVPVFEPRDPAGDWVVRVDAIPPEARAVWMRARDDHRSPKLACVVSAGFPSLLHFVAVAEVSPPRWRARARNEPAPCAMLPSKVTPEQAAALSAELAACQPATNSRTLSMLGIRRETLNASEFAGTWHIDHRGRVIFAYGDADGIVGLQHETSGAEPSGDWADETIGCASGLWHSNPRKGDRQLVITTRVTDALAYHQQHPGHDRRYLAVSPMPTAAQAGLVSRAVAQMAQSSQVIIATSRSLPAEYLIDVVRRACNGIALFQDSPPSEADRWTATTWGAVAHEVTAP